MSNQKHILIIRLSAMGDVAMTVPVVYAFAKANPQIKISFLSKPFFKPIVETLPNVHFIPAQVDTLHKGIAGIWKLSRESRKQGITHVADLHNVIRSKMLVAFLGKPAVKIDKGRAEKKALISGNNKNFKQLKTTADRYSEVFTKMGFSMSPLQSLPRPSTLEMVAKFTQKNRRKWLGIAPFAAHSGKQYPLHLMREVLEKLDDTAAYDIFLFGAPSEINVLEHLSEGCLNTYIVAGKLKFREEINLIGQLDTMLSMDSGNGHLAAIFGVRTVTLWGVTHPFAGFAPFEQGQHCLLSDRNRYPLIPTSIYGNNVPEGYENIMESITPESVIAAIETGTSA